ncbi:MAG: hypothetical protein LBN30_09890 [Oscillospiraceae bacterium]|jgi:hypothetical protein|nr:hypothetical protein [Oscillospiraceae bacterium]
MTAKDLKRRIDEYFALCAEEETFPDEAGMLLFVGIDRATCESYARGEGGELRRRCIAEAELRRESITTRDLYAAKSGTSGKLYLLRQATPESRKPPPKLTVEVNLGDGADSFE